MLMLMMIMMMMEIILGEKAKKRGRFGKTCEEAGWLHGSKVVLKGRSILAWWNFERITRSFL